MSTKKITITLEDSLVDSVDTLVKTNGYKSRSKAIQIAIGNYLKRMEKKRLYDEIDKLNQNEEMKVAEESLEAVNEIWDKY